MARDLKYTASGDIDMLIEHPEFGLIPFTASPHDVEDHGRDLYVRAKAGEFGLVAPYVAPVPSQADVVAQYERALDEHLDGVAQKYRYADRTRLALRAGYANGDRPLAEAFATWMDEGCNRPAKQLMLDVIAGKKPLPTIEAFLAGLPPFVPPPGF